MKTFTSLIAAGVCAAVIAFASAANAGGLTQGQAISKAETGQGVTFVQYGRCAYWYRVCRYRWGFGYPFRRCMAIHACL